MLKNYLKLFWLILWIHNSFGAIQIQKFVLEKPVIKINAASPLRTRIPLGPGPGIYDYTIAATVPAPGESSQNLPGLVGTSTLYRAIVTTPLNVTLDQFFTAPTFSNTVFNDITHSPSNYFAAGGRRMPDGKMLPVLTALRSTDGGQTWIYIDNNPGVDTAFLHAKWDDENNTVTSLNLLPFSRD